jgi:hypothetical protein
MRTGLLTGCFPFHSALRAVTPFRVLLLFLYILFWAGMVRKLPDKIFPETPCEAACRHDPRKVVLSGEAMVRRQLAADTTFVERSGPVSQKALWTLCHWAAPSAMTPFYNSADAHDPRHQSTTLLVDLLAELEAGTGAVAVVRSGAALGAYRDQRRTSCDSDLDVWIVVPHGQVQPTLAALTALVARRPALLGINNVQAFARVYYDPRMTIGRIWHIPDGNHIDFEIITEGFTQDPLLDAAYRRRCNISTQRLFASLCRCRYGNRTSMAAFSDMRPYLAAMYGADFELPILAHYDQRCTVQVHYPRAFLRSPPMRWLRSWLEMHPAFDLVDPLDMG